MWCRARGASALLSPTGWTPRPTVVGERPEHDLAVLQAKELPDDLMPATMRSTAGLQPGDEVVAVGFPFGIGPSASAGVDFWPEARLCFARGQAASHQSHPVRRRGESRQFRRAARHARRRGRSASSPGFSIRPSSASSSASASPCRSRTRPPRSAFLPSRKERHGTRLHATWSACSTRSRRPSSGRTTSSSACWWRCSPAGTCWSKACRGSRRR